MGARFFALDRLRALAVVSMVQGHTFTALMTTDALPSWAQQVHATVHGLTAPMFLMGAGLAFGLATYPRYESHHRGGAALWPRLRRYAWLFVIGYALQLPGSSLFAALRMPFEELAPVFRVGPLHLVACCLLVSQLAALLLRSARAHAVAMCALAAAVSLAAPAVYAGAAGRAAGPVLGPWLDASWGSLFPIFPWAAYIFFGITLGALLSARPALPRPATWLVPGTLLALLGYALFRLGVRWSDPAWFWYASPLHVLFRGGLVCALLGALHALPTPAAGGRVAGWTLRLSQHSLIAFVVHLLLLYGTPFTPNLARLYERSLDLTQVSLVFAAVMALTLVAVRAWSTLMEGRHVAHGLLRATLTTVGVLVLMR